MARICFKKDLEPVCRDNGVLLSCPYIPNKFSIIGIVVRDQLICCNMDLLVFYKIMRICITRFFVSIP